MKNLINEAKKLLEAKSGRSKVTLDQISEAWDKMYGEDISEEHSGFWTEIEKKAR